MIKFATEEAKEYMGEVVAFAKEVGAISQLNKKLSRLANFRTDGVSECYLCKDFAPNSFYFTLFAVDEGVEPRVMMSGGLIYSGPGRPLSGCGESRTVSLDEDDDNPKHNWSIHT